MISLDCINEKVSVIMPCHNGEKFLVAAIESVLNQTYKNFELIIVNDNSRDNSKLIIEKYLKRDSRIKFLENVVSTGKPSSPRNLGIKAASGRYIAFLDCDDLWMPSKLENQLKFFSNSNSVVFSYYQKIDSEGRLIGNVVKAQACVTYKKLLNGNCIGNLTGIYDTFKVGKIFQEEVYHEDYVMWLSILKKGYCAINTRTTEALYRVSQFSMSSNKSKSSKWTWQIYRDILGLPLLECCFHYFLYAIKGLIKYFF